MARQIGAIFFKALAFFSWPIRVCSQFGREGFCFVFCCQACLVSTAAAPRRPGVKAQADRCTCCGIIEWFGFFCIGARCGEVPKVKIVPSLGDDEERSIRRLMHTLKAAERCSKGKSFANNSTKGKTFAKNNRFGDMAQAMGLAFLMAILGSATQMWAASITACCTRSRARGRRS